MNSLASTLTLPTACLSVMLAGMTLLIRRLMEALFPTLGTTTPISRAQRVWEQFALPAIPALLGTFFGIVVSPTAYPYPAVAVVTPLSSVLYGFTLGWFSSGGYRVIVALVKKKWNVVLPGASDPPPPLH